MALKLSLGMMYGGGDQTLGKTFLDLHGIAHFKEAVVAGHLELSSTSHKWNINFLRATHDWEVDPFTSFFTSLFFVGARGFGENNLCWVPSKRGFFFWFFL